VVGTNGKTSVALMTAALVEAAGRPAAACISPHALRWRDRIWIRGEEIGTAEFGAAVTEVAARVPEVERDLGSGGRITQFEAAVAASFVALRDAGVEVGVIEAGLGGRLDATNVLASNATALTSVALDHTEWLGSAPSEIAKEKLAVLREGTTLVVGRLSAEIDELAAAVAQERSCRLVRAGDPPVELLPGRAPYARRNATVALELAATLVARPSSREAAATLAGVSLPGRAELLSGDPPMIVDAAHNAEGAEALAEALAELSDGRPVYGCVSVLADKDADAIAAALAPLLERVVCTAADPGPAMGRPGAAALEPAQLAAAFRRHGVEADAGTEPAGATRAVLDLARGGGGVALFAGSHYLLRHAWTARHAQSSSR
jgi:dihydrofolate synthase/folylpolyglutamate synthase